jgi:twinkle protein
MSKIIGDTACPQCTAAGGDRTGNHLMLFEDGGAYCNRCGYTETNKEQEPSKLSNKDYTKEIQDIQKLRTLSYRNIDQDILAAAGVRMETSESNRDEITKVFYPVYEVGRLEPIGYKVRGIPKNFYTVGSLRGIPKQLFGQQQVGEGGRLLIICEGEDDTLMARQILKDSDKAYNVVGLSFGAAHAGAVVRDNINWIETFDQIILSFDQDKPGFDAAEEAAKLITPGKVKVARFVKKDVIDMFEANLASDWLKAIWRAKTYSPRGIVNPKDVKERYMSKPPRETIPFSPEFQGLQDETRGLGRGELMVVTGGTGGGKSQFVDSNAVFWANSGYRAGLLKLEHAIDTSIEGLLSVHMGVNLKVPELNSNVSDEEKSKAYDGLFENNNLWLIDHAYEDSDDSGIIDQVRTLMVTLQCDVVVIDHLHAILYEESGDSENSRIDSILRTLLKMGKQHNCGVVVVAHPRKTTAGGKSAEQGAFISMDDLKGSSGLKQQPDIIVSLVRDSSAQSLDAKRTADVHLLKARYIGETGLTGRAKFDPFTSKYEYIPKDVVILDEEDSDAKF